MYIAVTNAHGWGKAETENEARKIAVRNSSVKRHDKRLLVTIWPCEDDAHVDGFGAVYGITGHGREYRPLGATRWGSTRIVYGRSPD